MNHKPKDEDHLLELLLDVDHDSSSEHDKAQAL
jgi:hypothetical protein